MKKQMSNKKIILPNDIVKQLESYKKEAQKFYDNNELSSKIWDLQHKSSSLIENYCRNILKIDKSFDVFQISSKNEIVTFITKLAIKRKESQENMTVGELIKHLSRFDHNIKIVIPVFESCVTDAGSELGSDHDYYIADIQDLGNRITITTERTK